MDGVTVFPYILPSDGQVKVIHWQQRVKDEFVPIQEILPHWDAGTILDLSVEMQMNLDNIYAECHLSSEDVLRATIVWHSSGTTLRGRGDYRDLKGTNSSLPITLTLTLPGELLADRVEVGVQLVLANFGKSSFQLAPRRPGTILWEEKKVIILEGVASRFPIELIDFSESSWLPEDAAWFLDWDDTNLDQMALKGLRLLMNAGNSRVKRAVTESLVADKVVRDIIYFEVGKTIIMGSLENEAFRQNPHSFGDGSIGSYARRLIHSIFSNEGWDGIINLYCQNRSRFECELQARFRLFHGA